MEIKASSKEHVNKIFNETSFFHQVSKISGRALINIKRDSMIFKGRLIGGILLSLVIGGIYFGVGKHIHGYRALQSITGIIFFMIIASI